MTDRTLKGHSIQQENKIYPNSNGEKQGILHGWINCQCYFAMFLASLSRSPNILHPEMWLGSWCYSVFTLTANVGNPENLKVQREFMVSNTVNINLIFVGLYNKYVCSSIEKGEEKISCSCKHVYKVYWNN